MKESRAKAATDALQSVEGKPDAEGQEPTSRNADAVSRPASERSEAATSEIMDVTSRERPAPDTESRLYQLMSDTLPPLPVIRRYFRFKQDLELDSLDALDLAIAVQDEFGVDFTDQEIDQINTVGDLVDAVEKRRRV